MADSIMHCIQFPFNFRLSPSIIHNGGDVTTLWESVFVVVHDELTGNRSG